MALLSFGMDFVIEKCQEAKIWLYKELSFSLPLQFVAWVSYSIVFILFATGFTHIVSPQAIGSGIPEMKTILRGVVLKEYLTFRTLVAKIVGLCSSLGSTLPIGKEGPFVHVASIVATLLSKFITSFRGIFENESRKSEMLAAACAVGVACTFAAPIGGVLFSIEVTATYFAVRNYWRGFFAAVCGALVFRLLAFWFKDEETITAVFRTNLRTEFPFDALELIAFAAIGIVCGFAGPLFILLHQKIIIFTRRRKRMSSFLQKNRFIYPGLVALIISSLTFPPGLGQFFSGELTHRQAINELFSNITWSTGQAEDLADEQIISHWRHPATNIYVNLVIFIIMTFWMGAMSNTLPVPAGIFVPVFTVGAAFGRLVGESMAAWFPVGIRSSSGAVHKIMPGGYAVVGAAALSGSVTRTISTSVIVFELTGQISHVLPAVIAVLIANGIAHQLQPSFYDSIIKLKRLPYLPDIVSAKSRAWNVYVEDIMIKDLKFISFVSTYAELQDLLMSSFFRSYPLVDSTDSMILLGSIQRFELERQLMLHLSHEQKVIVEEPSPDPDHDGIDRSNETREISESEDDQSPTPEARNVSTPEDVTVALSASSPTPKPEIKIEQRPLARFQVQKVDEDKVMPIPKQPSASDNGIMTSGDEISDYESTYSGSLRLPKKKLKSILKKSPRSTPRSSPTPDRKDLANLYKSFSDQSRPGIVEDVPYYYQSNNDAACKKHVQLPPETVKVKTLLPHEQEAWEEEQLKQRINFDGCQIDPAPFQLVERTSLHKVHSLFSLLGLNHAYVTNTGKLVGVVALKELRHAIQGRLEEQENSKKGGKNMDEDEIELDDPAQLQVVTPTDGHTDTSMVIDSNTAKIS
ncbi:chloride channel protein 2-like isoform X2 [Liolophura sinensis]